MDLAVELFACVASSSSSHLCDRHFASSAELPDSPSSPEEAAEDAAAEAAAADLARASTGRPSKSAPQAAQPTTLAARLSAAVDRIRAHVDGETTALTLKQTSGDL